MSSANKQSVLIIDSDNAIVNDLTKRLKNRDMVVITAKDGYEGYVRACKEAPDIIILDTLLSSMSGFRVSRLLKYDERFQHIKIVMITSNDLQAIEETYKSCGADEILRKLDEKSRMKRNKNVKENMKNYYSRLKADPEKMNKKIETVMKSRQKLKNEDPDKLKDNWRNWKSDSRVKLRNEDYKGEKHKIRNWTAESRKRLREEDPEAYKDQGKKDDKSKKRRQDKSVADRLRKFQEAVMYGPMFICVSCHGKMFRCSVKILTNRVVEQIDEKIPIQDCIDFDVVTQVVTESRHCNWPPLFKKNDLEIGERFICETCLRYLKTGKLPPKSFKNSLELHHTDEDLKEQDLRLTELEASLIAQNIVFQKIYQLPKSRWTGLKDKVINVPISKEAINNTLAQLPRTPEQAGLIGISLKRRKTMKNTHLKQLINPYKIFRMIQKLKESGSPYHQNLMTPANFSADPTTEPVCSLLLYSLNVYFCHQN